METLKNNEVIFDIEYNSISITFVGDDILPKKFTIHPIELYTLLIDMDKKILSEKLIKSKKITMPAWVIKHNSQF